MGPLNDIANEKLATEMPNEFEVAGMYNVFIHIKFKSSIFLPYRIDDWVWFVVYFSRNGVEG